MANEEKAQEIGAKWVAKEFADKIKRVSIQYKYNPDGAIKFEVIKEMIYDRLLMNLIKRMKQDGFIEIKETQENDESTISMCVNVLKNDFKQAMEEKL